MKPLKRCSVIGCSARVDAGRCEPHRRAHEQHRGSRHERGYDHAWDMYRAWHLTREPLCRFCKQGGKVMPANEVDHIRAFRGLNDPLRLDPQNVRSLCSTCHARRTRQQQLANRQGAGITGAAAPADRPGVDFSRSQNGGADGQA